MGNSIEMRDGSEDESEIYLGTGSAPFRCPLSCMASPLRNGASYISRRNRPKIASCEGRVAIPKWKLSILRRSALMAGFRVYYPEARILRDGEDKLIGGAAGWESRSLHGDLV